jgi:hypothetical protein
MISVFLQSRKSRDEELSDKNERVPDSLFSLTQKSEEDDHSIWIHPISETIHNFGCEGIG